MRNLAAAAALLLLSGAISTSQGAVEPDQQRLSLSASAPDLWEAGTGEGFSAGANTLTVGPAIAFGLTVLGSLEAHDFAFASLSYGRMIGKIKGEGKWYRGNWELRAELFTGAQYSPSAEWLVGLSPHLRYNFATGTPFIPFIDGGAGVTGTSIGRPDLSGNFQFNEQATVGFHYFFSDMLAFTAEARFIHLSCAGINMPNRGVNSVVGMFGLTWLF